LPPDLYRRSLHDALPISVRLLVLRASGEQVLQSHGGSFPVVGLRGQLSGSGCDREDVAAGDRDGQDGDDECHEKPWHSSSPSWPDRKSTRLNSSHVSISY